MAGQRKARPDSHCRSRIHGRTAFRQSSDHPSHQPGRYSPPSRAAGAATVRLPDRPGAAYAGCAGAARSRHHCAGCAHHAAGGAEESRVTEFSPHVVLPLLLWGTLVGLDLVSVPQAMISRPVVAGAVAGALAGDVEAGFRIGVLFELFALDVLPVGAVRYPDYGPATIGAVALSAGTPWELGLGVGTAFGLVLAVIGGWSLQVVRRDRKSTRLNSSHANTSYAVFCLKKKKTNRKEKKKEKKKKKKKKKKK